MSAGSEFLDYDNYKSKISSIWDKIWDKVDWVIDGVEEVDFGDVSIDENNSENKGVVEENVVSENEENDISDSKEKQTIKKFPKSLQVVKFPSLDKKENERNDDYFDENKFDDWTLTWYSKSDLIWIVNKYVEKNLDDDTDILVTVEYEDDSSEPQKIILQTQKRFTWEIHSASISWSWLNDLLNWNGVEKVDSDSTYSNENIVSDAQDNHVNNWNLSTKKATSTKLTKKELDEAEEIFSILF